MLDKKPKCYADLFFAFCIILRTAHHSCSNCPLLCTEAMGENETNTCFVGHGQSLSQVPDVLSRPASQGLEWLREREGKRERHPRGASRVITTLSPRWGSRDRLPWRVIKAEMRARSTAAKRWGHRVSGAQRRDTLVLVTSQNAFRQVTKTAKSLT